MEARVLVKLFFVTVGLLLGLSTFYSQGLQAADRQDIRFYKINKDKITQKLRFTSRKARKPGCHNFIKKARLHRAVQFGYETCRVYSKKNCAADSLMDFYREKEPEFTATDLSQGYGWYPVGEHKRGEKVKSWLCE